jgi:ABC-type sugar transport system substrate-binding protein
MFEDLIAEKVDAIAIAPGDSQRLLAAPEKSHHVGAKVANFRRGVSIS